MTARLRGWAWALLTWAALAGVLALIRTVPAQAAPAPAAATASWAGQWRLVLYHGGGPLPVGLELRQQGGRWQAWLLNPPERLAVEQVSVEGDQLVLAFPSYGSILSLTQAEPGRLRGNVQLARRSGPVTLAATATRDSFRFSAAPHKPAANLTGRWTVTTTGTRPQTGLAQFVQKGNLVTGSVQFPTGDTRYLAGELDGDTLRLSHFDGSSSAIWTAKLDNGVLTGGQYGATSTTPSPWSARRANPAGFKAVAVEGPGAERWNFSFPDATGRQISLADARFRGKVVVITLGGAWCPNCHDEAGFIGPYAARRQKEGLEVIGLHFEYGTDAARAFRQISSFGKRYGLAYPLLLAGEPTPESTKAALGALGPVKVYPSTIFIGRDGRVREVHVGWAGPATGSLNAKAKREFDETVTRLLRERA